LNKSWILFVASRYIFKGRSSSPVLAVLGICVGVMALIVIISVMNGFQLGFIESIIEISSYHLRIESFTPENAAQIQEAVLSVPPVTAAVQFREFQALARGRRYGQQAVHLRGVYENTVQLDKFMESRLEFEEGGFDLSDARNVLLGTELARRLSLRTGDEITIYSITGIMSAETDEGGIETFTVAGIFRTGYFDYDSSWAFININSVDFLDPESEIKIGVKLTNRFHDKISLDQIQKKLSGLGFSDLKLSSWRDYNRSFFGALRTEKLFMFILVGLIFIVAGLNNFQAQRRSVLHRREEIGLMRAVGSGQKAVQFVFIIDGAVIGLTGAFLGLFFGLAIASNIQAFFTIVETVINYIIGIMNSIADIFGTGTAGNFAVFSPAVFYIKEIPSKILTHEVILIFMFGFLSALTASWLASRKITKIIPAEVLRYE